MLVAVVAIVFIAVGLFALKQLYFADQFFKYRDQKDNKGAQSRSIHVVAPVRFLVNLRILLSLHLTVGAKEVDSSRALF